MATPNIDKLINLNRFQNGITLVPLIFYIPIGVMLMIVRSFIFLHALCLFFFLSKVAFVRNVLLRIMFAVCGLVVTTDGILQTNRRLILVANHVSSLDPFMLYLVLQYSLVVEPFCSSDFTQLCDQVVVPGHLGKEDVIQFIKKTVEENKLPVLIFPEGSRGNGSSGLLSFRVLPFQLDTAVQPIGIIARRWFFNINISTLNSPWWADLLVTFFVPFTLYSIRYLPITQHRDQESDEQFCERVQSNLAKSLGVAATSVTPSDVKEFVKNKIQGRATVLAQATTTTTAAGRSPTKLVAPEAVKTETEVKSSDPALNTLFKQVKEVLPHANSRAILEDLEKTKDVDVTITNILEGRVKLEPEQPPSPPKKSTSQTELEASTFKADNFPKSATQRQMSLQERKQAMLEAAQKRYKEKHGIP